MKRFLFLALAMAGIFSMAACGGGNDANKAGSGGGKKIDKLIITAIPDDNADKLKEHFGNVAKYLEGKIGIPVEYMHVENYAASVTALANGQAHMSWMGGVTTVQSDMQTKGNAVVVACRDIDKKFVTYFIANKDSGVGEVKDLKELSEKAGGKSFTFGSKGSTSGHLMPRHFFTTQAGKKPEDAFNNVGYSGSHDKTLAQVADGSFAVGALNYASYDKASADLKAKAPIIYKTPAYVDYSFVAHKDLGDEMIGKIRKALLDLDPNSEEGKKILGYFKAGSFVQADMKEWDGIRAVMESGVDIGS
ncbi:MAG: putative selenate ABC transporter substrate-binding protein [Planctomycetes bacterium]|nr:putative selenate ABC transporter substrate-binding protein [Planctomycetota bacterium]MCW8136878.1 putative selenate ABC transporter substrate-binding protein [Planctomycetota bacterium]